MKTITIFDDLENNKEDYHDIINNRSDKTVIILLNSYYENKKKIFIQYIPSLKKKRITFEKNC